MDLEKELGPLPLTPAKSLDEELMDIEREISRSGMIDAADLDVTPAYRDPMGAPVFLDEDIEAAMAARSMGPPLRPSRPAPPSWVRTPGSVPGSTRPLPSGIRRAAGGVRGRPYMYR